MSEIPNRENFYPYTTPSSDGLPPDSQGCAGSPELSVFVYDQLRSLARAKIAAEPAGHTLQATALVHEVYLRLMQQAEVRWSGPRHFFGAAAEAMRRILIDHARGKNALKRGGGRKREAMYDVAAPDGGVGLPSVLALDEALDKLLAMDARMHEIVMLRYFAGQTVEKTAELVGVAPRTVKREWAVARAWLRSEVGGADEPSA